MGKHSHYKDYSDDEDDYYSEQDDINNSNPQPNNNQNNITEAMKFDGLNYKPNGLVGWVSCNYCAKYHPNDMHFTTFNYCGHCWGWLNSEEIKLTEGKYNGSSSLVEVIGFLKKTIELHPKTCKNSDCVYNKIIEFEKKKMLHNDFCIGFGFKEKKELTEKEDELTEKIDSIKLKKDFKIYKTHSNPKINYNLSTISI